MDTTHHSLVCTLQGSESLEDNIAVKRMKGQLVLKNCDWILSDRDMIHCVALRLRWAVNFQRDKAVFNRSDDVYSS